MLSIDIALYLLPIADRSKQTVQSYPVSSSTFQCLLLHREKPLDIELQICTQPSRYMYTMIEALLIQSTPFLRCFWHC